MIEPTTYTNRIDLLYCRKAHLAGVLVRLIESIKKRGWGRVWSELQIPTNTEEKKQAKHESSEGIRKRLSGEIGRAHV